LNQGGVVKALAPGGVVISDNELRGCHVTFPQQEPAPAAAATVKESLTVRELTLATLCDMVLGEDAADRSDDALIRAVGDLVRNSGQDVPQRCQCGTGTGWTEIKCCNLCGMVHKDEALPWFSGPSPKDPTPASTQQSLPVVNLSPAPAPVEARGNPPAGSNSAPAAPSTPAGECLACAVLNAPCGHNHTPEQGEGAGGGDQRTAIPSDHAGLFCTGCAGHFSVHEFHGHKCGSDQQTARDCVTDVCATLRSERDEAREERSRLLTEIGAWRATVEAREAERDALREALELIQANMQRIDAIRWGYDGDAGASDLAEDSHAIARAALNQTNPPPPPSKEDAE
jgi:hypothetical protein